MDADVPKLTPEQLDAAAERWFAHVDRLLDRCRRADAAKAAEHMARRNKRQSTEAQAAERSLRLKITELRRDFRERFLA